MANLIDTVIDNIETGLAALTAAGTLKKVVRRIIVPGTETTVPILGIIPSSLRRQGGSAANPEWVADVTLALCTRAKDTAGDALITDLVAQVHNTIKGLSAPGGVIDLPRWDFWYVPSMPQSAIGAVGSMRIKTTGTLLVS